MLSVEKSFSQGSDRITLNHAPVRTLRIKRERQCIQGQTPVLWQVVCSLLQMWLPWLMAGCYQPSFVPLLLPAWAEVLLLSPALS